VAQPSLCLRRADVWRADDDDCGPSRQLFRENISVGGVIVVSDPRSYVDRIVSAWRDNNPALLDDLMDDEYVLHAFNGNDMSLQDLEDAIRDVRALIPDFEHTVQDVVGQGDVVAYRWMMRGTHTGSLPDFPATGRVIDYQGISFFHIQDGRIHEEWFGLIGRPIVEQLRPPSNAS
jgi:steroid delta-isomerase-like uncharacterized protein